MPNVHSTDSAVTPSLWWRLIVFVIVVAVFSAGALQLKKDTGLDAFVPADSDALAIRKKTIAIFGLTDPVVVALVGSRPGQALEPATLTLIRRLSRDVALLPGINPDGVHSIATAQWMQNDGDTLSAQYLLPEGEIGDHSAAGIMRGLEAVPAYSGLLISEDFSSLLLIADLRENAAQGEVYLALQSLVDRQDGLPGLGVYIAGDAAVSGFLSDYIDRDRLVVMPITFILMLVLVGILCRSLIAVVVAGFVLLSTLGATFGLMGWFDARYYVITGSLPVVLICISVADTVHLMLLARKYELQSRTPAQAISRALHELRWPIRVTSLTTASGFIGIALSSDIPAFAEYGIFAAIGVLIAWRATVLGGPFIYRFRRQTVGTGAASAPVWVMAVARYLTVKSRFLQLGAGLVVIAGAIGFLQLQFNYERIRNFASDSEMYLANAAINEKFDGTYFLDVYIQAPAGTTVLLPEVVAAMAEAQIWLNEQHDVTETWSALDLISSTAQAALGEPVEIASMSTEDIEQYLFLYEISAKPGDLNQEISADRSQALIRAYLKHDNFKDVRPLVEQSHAVLPLLFAATPASITVTGPVDVLVSWMVPLRANVILGVSLAMLLVWALAAIMLRSIVQGFFCLAPVGCAVVMVYGLMGVTGIWLDVVTSMFASIGIGIGVDFSIYAMNAARRAASEGLQGRALVRRCYEEVLQPLTVNTIIVLAGFSVGLLASVPPVANFCMLVASTSLFSYVMAMAILPSLFGFYSSLSKSQDTPCAKSLNAAEL